MKKIYLLLLLCLLRFQGFSATWYTVVNNGDITNTATWNNCNTGCGFSPFFPGGMADTWYVQCPVFLPDAGNFTIHGTLIFQYGFQILRKGTTANSMNILGSVIFPGAPIGPGSITSVSGAGAFTLTVGKDIIVQGTSYITDTTSNPTIINIGGNLVMTGNAYISSAAAGYKNIIFDGTSTLASPQTITWTSTGASKYTTLEIDAPDNVALLTNVPLPTLGASPPAGLGEILSGTLNCNTFGMSGDGTQLFYIDSGASLYTADIGGMDSTVKRCADSFSKMANYIFDGINSQITGVTMPDSIYGPGYVTINNPAGVVLSKNLHFGNAPAPIMGAPALNLELGTFTIGVTDSILSMLEAGVNVDTGTFSSAPTYYPGNVDVSYVNLGYNALAVTTGYELQPTLPISIESTAVNKPGAIITLGSSFITGDLDINAGTLDASATNYNITLNNASPGSGQWYNNVGLSAFVPRSGTVAITGNRALSLLTGTSTTTFFNLTLNDTAGAQLGIDEIVNGTLTLNDGKLFTNSNNLILGPLAPPIVGTFGDTSMIVISSLGSGVVQKQDTGDVSYFFPIGDSANYSPIRVNFSGSGSYGATAYTGVTVHNQKEPHNSDTINYLNRYWRVTTNNITAPSYTAVATYVPGDVVGTEGDMAMGEYGYALPWKKFGVTNVATHTLTSGVITDTTADFTGVDSSGPTVTASDDTTICLGGFDTLRVLSVTGDTPFVYTWAPAASLSATTGTVVVATPTVTTTYTVTVTDANGTSGTDTVMITVNPIPTLSSATNNGPICSGGTLSLVANTPLNVTGYLWRGSVIITDSTANPASIPNDTTLATSIYTVTVVNGVGSGCTATYFDTAFVDPLPTIPLVTGGGVYCDSNTIFASNGDSGIIYFQDTFSNATSTAVPDTLALITYLGTHTYYFRAQSIFGCWGPQDSTIVTINPLPTPDTAFGAGTFCDSTMISASNGDSGTIYFQGTVSGGTSTTMGGSPQKITTSGIYYFRSRSAAGCWGAQASDTVYINPTPAPVTVTAGGGTFCGADTLTATGGTGGTIYFEGNTSNDTDISIPYAAPPPYVVVDTSGTYYFRAQALGCWSRQDSAIVVIHPLPATVIISTNGGGSVFCDSTTIFASNGGDGIIYYEDTMTNSFSMAMAAASAFLDSANTYGYLTPVFHFRARNPVTGCWSNDTGVQITINELPWPVTATGGGGPFCGSTQIAGDDGVAPPTYTFFEGNAPGGTTAGLGSPVTVDTSGTYYFRAENTATGCWSREGVSDDSVRVLINPLPPIHNVTGGGTMCFRDLGFDIGIDGSDTGIKYQLYNGTTLVGRQLTGTTFPLDFGIDTIAGTYTVIAIDTATGCNDTTGTSAIVVVNPLPNVYPLNPPTGSSYCFGGTGVEIDIVGTDNFTNYLVYRDSILDTTVAGNGDTVDPFDLGNFTDSGKYTVVAITSNGCTLPMLDSVVVVINPLPTPYTVTGGGVFCDLSAADSGVHVFLSGSDTGVSYQLYNGAPLPTILPGTGGPLDFGLQTVNGTYTVVATNSTTTCTNNMRSSANVLVNEPPSVQTTSGGGGYCIGGTGLPINVDATESGDSYQLYFDGAPDGSAIIGTGSPISFPLQSLAGSYTVIATNPGTGCVQADSFQNTSSVDVTITINALPLIYTVFGGGSYCVGGTGFNIGISSTQAGVIYELFNGSTQVDSITGTGLVGSFGVQATPGTYTVIGKTALGCSSNMAGSATIIVNSLPLVDTVTGGGAYCSGGTGKHVGLNSSTIGINYQLSMGGASVGAPVPGTSSTLDFGLLLPAGVYKVSAMNVVTGCISGMADSATISIEPLPNVYDITGGGSFCSGSTGVSLGITSSDPGIKYQLFHGTATSGSPIPGTGLPFSYGVYTTPGSYVIIATDSTTGCTDSMAGSATISINALPPVHLLLGGGTYCVGSPGVDVKLSISDDGYVYLLYNGSTTVGPPLAGTDTVLDFGLQTLPGTYYVVAIDTATTCSDSMRGSATVIVETPFIPVVSIAAHPGTDVGVGQRDTLIAQVTGGGPDVTYQWFVNGNVVPGATGDTFAFNIYYNTDSLTCQVTSHGLCGDYTRSQSVFITLHNVGISQVTTGSDIKLMPNPNKGTFTIKGTLGTAADEEVSIEVTDMLGQVVYQDKIIAPGGSINKQIQLNSSLANGMYLLNLRSGAQENVFHFVVEQ